MCIALLTTAHPDYALILIDNRDEYILRPTSRPHWWTPSTSTSTTTDPPAAESQPQKKPQILSSIDLQRPEHGTWLGITKTGNLAVLTNYSEAPSTPDIAGGRSRGAIVTAWLGAPPAETTPEFIRRMLAEGLGSVGGFSLICGQLRRRRTPSDSSTTNPRHLAPLFILSNRAVHPNLVPTIFNSPSPSLPTSPSAGETTIGLSNAAWDDDAPPWPKVEAGKRLLAAAAAAALPRAQLLPALLAILDTDTLPRPPGLTLAQYIPLLRESVFVPALGDAAHRQAMVDAAAAQAVNGTAPVQDAGLAVPPGGFATGMYGTQRQTVVLVDWEGNVTYVERALWDECGRPIERGEGDVCFEFKIEGWDEEETMER